MPFRHPVIGGVLAVTRIGEDVIRSYRAGSLERRVEDSRVARHGEFLERGARGTGQGVERVSLAVVTQHIVEKGPERCVSEIDAGIGHQLDELFQIALGGDRDSYFVEDLKRMRFLAKLGELSFQALGTTVEGFGLIVHQESR